MIGLLWCSSTYAINKHHSLPLDSTRDKSLNSYSFNIFNEFVSS